jgi:hypothetical protein
LHRNYIIIQCACVHCWCLLIRQSQGYCRRLSFAAPFRAERNAIGRSIAARIRYVFTCILLRASLMLSLRCSGRKNQQHTGQEVRAHDAAITWGSGRCHISEQNLTVQPVLERVWSPYTRKTIIYYYTERGNNASMCEIDHAIALPQPRC